MSLAKRITAYLQAKPGTWVSGDLIEKKSQEAGYKASTGSRRARELSEDGIIKRKEVDGYVLYCYEPEDTTEKPKTQHVEVVDKDGVPTAVVTYS